MNKTQLISLRIVPVASVSIAILFLNEFAISEVMSSLILVIFIYKSKYMKNQICTILGGGGFIGKYLARNMTKKNYRSHNNYKYLSKGYLKTQGTPGSIELLDWNPNNFSELKSIKNSDML